MIEKEKLQPELATPYLRLGMPSRIHPQVYSNSADVKLTLDSKKNNLLEQLEHLYQNIPFVATTCLGTNHPAITTKQQPFDYCILDEAGQCLMLSALGPLFYAEKFVLVGDPQQLPPLVQSQAAKHKGMDISLFSHLATKMENIIPLTMQYRMNEKIQALANHLTYNGRLECGSEDVAKRTLSCMKMIQETTEPQWMIKLLDGSSTESSIIFLNTDTLDNAMETTCDLGLYNPGEGDIVQGICKLFQNNIVSDTYHNDTKIIDEKKHNKITIGVIAPYRAQVMHLRGKLTATNDTTVDVNTVDQFQGQDKDVIVYSCTRSTPRKLMKTNEAQNSDRETKERGNIMCDERRLNVAITRAKCKLVILGNRRALQSYEPFEKLINFLQERENVFEIHSNDLGYLGM